MTSFPTSRSVTQRLGAAKILKASRRFSPRTAQLALIGPPAIGRAAIAKEVQAFTTTFPDMVRTFDKREPRGDRTAFHWTLTGTNNGPGGTGNKVRISGHELWKIGNDGLIAESKGHFDATDYEKQLRAE